MPYVDKENETRESGQELKPTGSPSKNPALLGHVKATQGMLIRHINHEMHSIC